MLIDIQYMLYLKGTVHFVDYGEFTVKSLSELRLLPAQFKTQPFLSIRAKLAGKTN